MGYVQPDNIYHAWNLVENDGNWTFYDATFGRSGADSADEYSEDRHY